MIHLSDLFRSLASIDIKGLCTQEDRDAIFIDLNGQLDSHRVAARQAMEFAQWQERLPTQEDYNVDVIVKLKPAFTKKGRLKKKIALRKATKRAAMLAAAFLGASTVSAFARGEIVMIEGPEVSLSAKVATHVAASGHGALSVGVHDTSGERLASLCVYQDMPALDQLVSLAMHVQSGCIDEVLNTGNLFAVLPAGDSHPAILSRKKPERIVNIPDIVEDMQRSVARQRWGSRMPPHDERELFEEGRKAYVAEMREIYEDTIADVVFGRAAKIWKAHRATLSTPDKGWEDD